MPHYTPLIATIVAGLVFAFIFGSIAQRLRISPIVGYLLAGVVAGPYTPGFVADQALAHELAELGVILLMFGVGLHFSLKDLLSVRAIAIPGAIVQIGAATLMGMGMAYFLGWGWVAGFVFGLALSVASTVVLLRALQERRLIETERGRIAVGWLIVEDLAMVLALVLLPTMATIIMAQDGGTNTADLWQPIAITLGKVAAFVVVMLVVGQRVIPWALHWVAHTGSRELFRLSVLAIAIGIAYAASTWFGASFALGAFFAGMVMSESPLSQRAAEETLPLRDAFAVLFFVSVGMLFNPAIVVNHPWLLAGTIFIIVFGKSIAAFLIVRAFKYPTSTALVISASLAQIGEFSFILAGLGVTLKLMPQTGLDLILAGAILSIVANPFVFQAIDWIKPRIEKRKAAEDEIASPAGPPEEAIEVLKPTELTNHAVIIGYGRVGSHIGDRLHELNIPYLVIEDRMDVVKQLRARGIEVFFGNAASPELVASANLLAARTLFVAIPESFEAGQVVEQARKINPSLEIVARAHSDAEQSTLNKLGANYTVMGEREIAQGMIEFAFKNNFTPGPVTYATTRHEA